jgi:hypothetical protein
MQAWKYSFCNNDEYYDGHNIIAKDKLKVAAKLII